MADDALPWTTPAAAESLEAGAEFRGIAASVGDFWQFALGDLRMNNARGHLAEFLVARSLGMNVQRVEWAEYDLLYGDTTIEVKSSAYLQAWEQQKLSKISFTGLKGKRPLRGGGYDDSSPQTFNADVYVFCVQTATTHEHYDPLDVGQWDFYVVPRGRLVERGYASIALSELQKLTTRIAASDLQEVIVRESPGLRQRSHRDGVVPAVCAMPMG